MEKESNNPFVFFSGYQGGGGVDPGQEFLVQGIQPFGIAACQGRVQFDPFGRLKVTQ